MSRAERISGVSRTSLWNAWKVVRQQLKKAPRRDVLDYLEFDIDPDIWINRLLRNLAEGEYMPQRPTRYTLAKSKGFSRVITIPAIPDLVLFRCIADYLFQKAMRKQRKHVYFNRATLSKVVRDIATEARDKIEEGRHEDVQQYTSGLRRAFLEWLKFDQYRKLLIFEDIYKYIVVTDITNFFDCVLYGRIEESLHDLPVPSRMVSLLFLLLESLSIREPYVPVQRIGLPVDPCDCSRILAHMALFPHDDRMVEAVGEDAYVRWMDDQNIGVDSKADGLKALASVDESLRRLHLTANAGKSKVLSLKEAKTHFHFNSNRRLDAIESLPSTTDVERRRLRSEL